LQFTVCISAFAQNLVPNPSFEDTVQCPTGYSQSTYAQGWTININSTDYYHACSNTPWFSTPNANMGYQCPANGNAYCGFIPYSPILHSSEEFIGCKLLNPLIIGTKYFVTFKISFANLSNCGIDKLGALFTNTFYNSTSIDATILQNNFAHVYSATILNDTTNWTTIGGSFIPDSSYEYILIGNFFNNNNLICFDTTINNLYEYYYIDDVCVSTDSLTCEISNGPNVCDSIVNISNSYENENITLYPNLTNDKIFVDFPYSQKTTIKIYDLMGQLLFDKSFLEKNITIDLSYYPDGMYSIQVQQDNKFFNKKILLIK
jgi:hypothetical protein